MVLIYSHKACSRLQYVLDFIFRENFGLDYQITTDVKEFRNYMGPKLNYSMERIEEGFHIFPVLLLFQDGVTEHQIKIKDWEGTKVFYNVKKGDLPFDLFAATFFLITRYEEYFYANRDRYGRYDPRNSLAWKYSFLYDPVVNIWLNKLKDRLVDKYPGLGFKENNYSYQPTIDIDNAYAYLHKGVFRTLGGIVYNTVRDKFSNLGNRTKVLLGFEKDPYDTYEYLQTLHKKYNLDPVYFFLLGNYGGNDHSLSSSNFHFRELIKNISDQYRVGAHPSFSSHVNERYFTDELSSLESIMGKRVKRSRFHFIRMEMPESYCRLVERDITEDYSMGYPSRVGFRSGYAGSFYFFDLRRNEPTNLKVHSFQVMDSILRFYLKLTPKDAIDTATEIIQKIKDVNGTFTSVWHNESLSEISPWKGWREVYEKIVEFAHS